MIDSSRVKHISLCNKTDKPWGYEILWAQTDDYVAKLMHINMNSRMSLQLHEKKEETLYVVSGELKVWESEDEEDFALYAPGHVYHVKPGQVHRFGANSVESVMLMEVSTPELDDVVRLADDYKR
jgi:mannose-6-phosphate isomerase|tara:strand:- start:44898 stop:45272 length:375 start_codon:yes stop_codon:yes gene_type:complete